MRACERAGRRVPVITQVTVETTGQMLLGSDIAAALTAIEPLGVDVIGMNCATGPAEMGEHLRYLAQHARTPLSCLPNAGLPELRDGKPWYPLTPTELAEAHTRFASEFGLSVVGGCCGTTPEHIRQVVEALAGRAPAPREPLHEPSLSSLYQSVPLDQDTTYLTVGERCNANGSRKFRDLMLEGDLDGMVGVAKEQIREGAHVLDVCVDYVGRDGAPDMDVLAARLAQQSTVPIMLDSTQADVLEAGLKRLGGRAIVNSINLEDGEARMDAVCPMARQYGAALVALLIDEEGQARDVDWKLRIAHRIHDLAVDKHGLAAEDLIFDALTFPLGSGQEDLRGDAVATLEAIRRIKAELPGVRTILGVSNVSFGLAPAARQVLNSVFLHEAREAGLDSAIVAPARILPMHRIDDEQRQVALDLIYDRRREGYDPLQTFMALFEGKEVAKAASAEDLAALPIDERLQRRIVDGVRDGLEADLAEAMTDPQPALDHQRGPAGRDEDGRRPVRRRRDAAAVRAPVGRGHEGRRGRARAPHGKGRPGRQGPGGAGHGQGRRPRHRQEPGRHHPHQQRLHGPQHRHQAADRDHHREGRGGRGRRHRHVRAAGQVDHRDARQPGGAERPRPGQLPGAARRGRPQPHLRRGRPAPDLQGPGLLLPRRLRRPAGHGPAPRGARAGGPGESRSRCGRPGSRPCKPRGPAPAPPEISELARSDVAIDVPVPTAPFLGEARVVKGIPVRDLVPYLNESALFRGQWQLRPVGGKEGWRHTLETEARPRLRALLDEAIASQILRPAVVYGYFPCNGDGNDVVVWDDDGRERVRFTFPRQRRDRRLCIADFFRPLSSGEPDVIGMHVVTMGLAASEATAKLFADNRYREYLELHGVTVEMAEALAEYWHQRVREELGIAGDDAADMEDLFDQGYRGSRYSFGYPACPDLEEQTKLFELLKPERIGVELSEEFQLHPEQSTSAIIVHHPEAKYFNAR